MSSSHGRGLQVGLPTDKDGKEHWPEETTAFDGE
jgi:hypothetical protein